MIDGILNSLLEKDKKTHWNIRKLVIGPEDDYMNGCLQNYLYFKKNCKLNGIDLKKQQILNTWCWSKSNIAN